MITLNQLISYFQALATNHKQINSFGFGDISEQGLSKNTQYPQMFVAINNASVEEKVLNYSFRFYFYDRVKQDEQNETEVLSDQILTALDILAELNSPSNGFKLVKSAPLQDFTESQPDQLSGWYMDVTLQVAYRYDRCSVPIDGNVFANGACPEVTIFNQLGEILATVPSGGSYVCNVTGGDVIVQNSDLTFDETYPCGSIVALDDITYNIYVAGNLDQSFDWPALKELVINIG